uniref:Uncharacterized protein n=1 Tax=Ditylenchus dipsaci TaxID=166011 RepID=A0A915DTX7_9BILA
MVFELPNYFLEHKIVRKAKEKEEIHFGRTPGYKTSHVLPEPFSNGRFNLFFKDKKVGCLEYEKDDEDENVLKVVMLQIDDGHEKFFTAINYSKNLKQVG